MRRLAVAVAGALALAVAGCGGAAGVSSVSAVPKVADLNRVPGEYVDLRPHLVDGMVTIIDFRADWCGACDKIEAMVAADLRAEPVVIRRIDVGEGRTPAARAYQVGALPHLLIFDRRRQLRFVLVGNEALRTAEVARSLLAE